MKVRKTRPEEIGTLMKLYDRARQFMRSTGNFCQWVGGYPSEEVIKKDISRGNSYILTEGEEILGVFCFMQEDDPTYHRIEGGKWLNAEPYGVIHRLASSGSRKHIGDECIRWCFTQCPNLRADTHRDNRVMQRVLERNGFVVCGTIYVEDGTPRIAYQCKQGDGPPVSS